MAYYGGGGYSYSGAGGSGGSGYYGYGTAEEASSLASSAFYNLEYYDNESSYRLDSDNDGKIGPPLP